MSSRVVSASWFGGGGIGGDAGFVAIDQAYSGKSRLGHAFIRRWPKSRTNLSQTSARPAPVGLRRRRRRADSMRSGAAAPLGRHARRSRACGCRLPPPGDRQFINPKICHQPASASAGMASATRRPAAAREPPQGPAQHPPPTEARRGGSIRPAESSTSACSAQSTQRIAQPSQHAGGRRARRKHAPHRAAASGWRSRIAVSMRAAASIAASERLRRGGARGARPAVDRLGTLPCRDAALRRRTGRAARCGIRRPSARSRNRSRRLLQPVLKRGTLLRRGVADALAQQAEQRVGQRARGVAASPGTPARPAVGPGVSGSSPRRQRGDSAACARAPAAAAPAPPPGRRRARRPHRRRSTAPARATAARAPPAAPRSAPCRAAPRRRRTRPDAARSRPCSLRPPRARALPRPRGPDRAP